MPGFDPALGTLFEIVLTANLRLEGLATFTNVAPFPVSEAPRLNWAGGFFSDGAWNMPIEPFFSIFSGLMAPGETVTVPFGFDTGLAFFPTPCTSCNANLPFFIDPGTLPAAFGSRILGGSSFLVGLTAEATRATLTVHYEYVPVPEPSTLLLLGTSGIALLAKLRRRGLPK